jgi:hypothetical protein
VHESVANEETRTTSSVNKPSKRAKVVDNVVGSLIGVLERGTETIANAIKEADVVCNALSTNLFESVDTLPGFELEHKVTYYAYLVTNPDTTRAFINLPFEYKLSWVTKFVIERF